MNANKLKAKIIERGFTIAEVSELIGISKHSMYRKINLYDKITIYEATRLKEALQLSNIEAIEIFLEVPKYENIQV